MDEHRQKEMVLMGEKPTKQEIADYAIREHRLFEMFKQGKRPVALEGLQTLADGQFPDRFERYLLLLLQPEAQLELLKEYNQLYWDSVLTEKQFAAIDVSDHNQTVRDLVILHVELDSTEATREAWVKVIQGTQSDFFLWHQEMSDPHSLRIIPNLIRHYQPGIHRIHIDLGAFWEPEEARQSIQRVRELTEPSGKKLAHNEVLSAYGLHVDLLQQVNGATLPYAGMAGYELDEFRYGKWDSFPFLRGANLNCLTADMSTQTVASPVVW